MYSAYGETVCIRGKIWENKNFENKGEYLMAINQLYKEFCYNIKATKISSNAARIAILAAVFL